MGKLTGKIALVTGGSEGIGFATAKLFAKEGAKVYITARRKEPLDAAVRAIGDGVVGVQGDAASLADLDRLYAQIEREQGRLDVLFVNAGISGVAPMGSIDEAHFDSIFGVNVRGMLFTVQKAMPLLKSGSTIVLNGSVSGSSGIPGQAVYNASKAAVRSFARTWTSELVPRGIRVNTISPGPIDTPAMRKHLEAHPQVREMIMSLVPMARLGTEDELAKTVLFLASDESSYVTGAELFADGGASAV